jgi:hypothetical protein
MPPLVDVLKLLAICSAAAVLGNWFLNEIRKSRRRKLPWYSAYLSPPGLLILAALTLPLLYWLARR